MLGRHFVLSDALPQKTLVWSAGHDRCTCFPSAKGSPGVTEVQLAFGIHTAVTIEAATGKDGRDLLIKIVVVRHGAGILRRKLPELNQNE
jgi:hypothetical protein